MAGRVLKVDSSSPYRLAAGVGGIGTGLLFALAGDHTLGRNESRPGRLLDVRDYCKLHIVFHYVSVLLGARPSGDPFRVLPIGKVGADAAGERLRGEMSAAGMDLRFLGAAVDRPTLLSVCFQYPDGAGGNITTTESAAAALGPEDLDSAARFLESAGGRYLALSAPEVSLESRRRLLEIASRHGAFRAASFASAEIRAARETGMFELLDLVALNEDEASMLGEKFRAEAPERFLEHCWRELSGHNPGLRVVVTAGRNGAFGCERGSWEHSPSLPVPVSGTAGAGDALLGGLLACTAAGVPFITPGVPRRALSDRPLAGALDLGGVARGIYLDLAAHDSPGRDARLADRFRGPARPGVRFHTGAALDRSDGVNPMDDLTDNPTAAEAARTARRLVRPVREDIVALLQQLVRADTVAVPPRGNEAAGQKVLVRALKARKIDVEMYDTGTMNEADHPYARRSRDYSGRPNVVARLTGSGGGRSLLLNGHIDTVPPGPNPWKDDPWSGRIARGRLYGRGSFDMKGGLAAQFGVILALKRAGLRLAGDLLCESVVDEEWGGGGGTLAARLRGDTADACSIGEVTNLSLLRATRGGYIFEIAARAGDPSRYFSKEEVIGPAVPMGRLLGWVDEWARKRRQVDKRGAYAEFPDPAPVQVLALEANRFDPETPWSVPLTARVCIYLQFLPHEDVPAVIDQVKASFRRFCRSDPFFRAYPPEWRDILAPPLLGHELDAGHEWVQCMARSASAVLRRPVRPAAAEFPCDAFLQQNLFGIPTVVFGPCGAGAHNQDEYVTITSVIRTAETLLAAALIWCSATITGSSSPPGRDAIRDSNRKRRKQ